MDLLGDLGAQDQLTSAREENAFLRTKVRDLTAQVQVLTLENQSLKAEVDMYRAEAALPNFSQLALGKQQPFSSSVAFSEQPQDHFVRSGSGIYPKACHVSLPNLHGNSNVLTCALSPDDTVVATGGADSHLSLCQWGRAYFNDDDDDAGDGYDAHESAAAVQAARRVSFSAPVIAASFSPTLPRVLACAGMDGAVSVVQYGSHSSSPLSVEESQPVCRHSKYVRSLAWSPRHNVLASASADGAVFLHKVERTFAIATIDDEEEHPASSLQVTKLESFHLPGAVEALCFLGDSLICYARNTPHLVSFDLGNGGAENANRQQQRKIHLNASTSDSHVSFAVMDMHCWEGKYLVAATDASRNFVLDALSGSIVRNLYGHANDGYSQPKVAWNHGGQYVLGNTQDDGTVVVWDVASSQIVDRLRGNHAHSSPVRDLRASHASETLVTTSFDKRTNLWFFDQDTIGDVEADVSM